ncbi:ABC transporter substrate-binding protein [Roseovarius sp. 2305UL8-3]|uniref:ABC transporter substrate-binding protein n=1 Tax=Roseovarius conchicola TaxID=3121636 RepID=UPI003526DB2C
MHKSNKSTNISRRSALKQLGASTALAGAGSVLGAPMIWAQEIKDVTLLHLGPSYSVFPDMVEQASADLGFKVEMQHAWTDGIMARVVNQPDTLDIADLEFWATQRVWRRGNMQALDISRINNWDKIIPIFRDGKNFDGSPMSTQGTLPFEVQYVNSDGGLANIATDQASIIPTIYNADTLGIRPDLIGRDVNSWAELLNPEFAGKTALINVPQIGIMDAAMAIEARGDITYGDKGNMTREEIDKTIAILIELKKAGHFRAFWSSFDESVNFMAAGEVVIQSMWSPAVTAVRSRGVDCEYRGLGEGYRGWGNGLGLMSHLDGLKRDAAYEYLNWMLSGPYGAFVARQGYYGSVPETTKASLGADEWDYWYNGKPAATEIKDPFGGTMEQPGRVRDGGSFEQRVGGITAWNTLMDEGQYLVERWNEFVAS